MIILDVFGISPSDAAAWATVTVAAIAVPALIVNVVVAFITRSSAKATEGATRAIEDQTNLAKEAAEAEKVRQRGLLPNFFVEVVRGFAYYARAQPVGVAQGSRETKAVLVYAESGEATDFLLMLDGVIGNKSTDKDMLTSVELVVSGQPLKCEVSLEGRLFTGVALVALDQRPIRLEFRCPAKSVMTLDGSWTLRWATFRSAEGLVPLSIGEMWVTGHQGQAGNPQPLGHPGPERFY